MGSQISLECRARAGNRPIIIIVGGGYGGVALARELDRSGQFFTMLIDRKDYYLHNIAALRASVEDGFSHKICVPYSKLFLKGNGFFIHGEVTAINDDNITINGYNEPVSFNYCVIATGSSYAFPCKVAEPHSEQAFQRYNRVVQDVKSSTNIVVVGGGPVGVELTGEIGSVYRDKKVYLIHSGKQLIGDQFDNKLSAKLMKQLTEIGVQVILEDRLDLGAELKRDTQNYVKLDKIESLTTAKGRSVYADCFFNCTGVYINSNSWSSTLSDAVDLSSGRLKTDNHLQVINHPKLFAIGDANSMQNAQAFYAGSQAAYLSQYLPKLNVVKTMKPYQPSNSLIMSVPIGKNKGVTQLGSMILGSRLTSIIKGKTLFVGNAYKALNVKLPSDGKFIMDDNQKLSNDEIENLSKQSGLTRKFVEAVMEGFLELPLAEGQQHV